MATALNQPAYTEQRVVLHGVQWETYERLLDDWADRTAPRLVFEHGTLEIRSPTAEHEEYNRTLTLLVEVTAEEVGVDVRRVGSTTFKRKDLLKASSWIRASIYNSLTRSAARNAWTWPRIHPLTS